MSGLLTVELKQLRFWGYHGLYPQERKTGNEFELNIAVSFESSQNILTDIESTVNYARLFELLDEQMKEPAHLLEELAMRIADRIHTRFPQVKKVDITILKLQPPIEKFAGSVGVRFQKEYGS